MAQGMAALGLATIVVAAFVAGASAQSGCTAVLISLAPCLGYIQGNSSAPSSSCCTQLASVVRSQPQCLCQVLNGGGSTMGISVNRTQALALPSACKVQTPPVSQCNAVSGGAPAAAPAEAPTPASPSTPSAPTTPAPTSTETPSTPSTPAPSTPASPTPVADGGSKTTPSGQASGGSSNKMTLPVFFCALFLASYASVRVL